MSTSKGRSGRGRRGKLIPQSGRRNRNNIVKANPTLNQLEIRMIKQGKITKRYETRRSYTSKKTKRNDYRTSTIATIELIERAMSSATQPAPTFYTRPRFL